MKKWGKESLKESLAFTRLMIQLFFVASMLGFYTSYQYEGKVLENEILIFSMFLLLVAMAGIIFHERRLEQLRKIDGEK